jgi:hypothetical protein
LAGSQAESLSAGVVAGTQVSTGHCAAIADAGHYLITDHRSCHLVVAHWCQNISAWDLSAWLQFAFRKQTRPANLRAYRELTRALPIGGRLNGQPTTVAVKRMLRLARPPRARQTGQRQSGNRQSDKARAEQDKAGNGHSEKTAGSEFFTHGTPPIQRPRPDENAGSLHSQKNFQVPF